MGTTYHGQHSGIILTSGFAAKNPVTIATDGTITAYDTDGIYGANYPWTIDNLGTIDSYAPVNLGGGSGVDLRAGGEVVNGATNDTTALIEGSVRDASQGGGINIEGGTGTVVNYGTIKGFPVAVELKAGGTVGNFGDIADRVIIYGPGGSVSNFGSISTFGVMIFGTAGGSVVNGTTDATTAVIQDRYFAGVYVKGGPGSVTNFGTIEGPVAVELTSGGSVVNGASNVTTALIAAEPNGIGNFTGVYIGGGSGTVTNYGTISGSGRRPVGIGLEAGGSITNSGSVFGYVYVIGGGSVTNIAGGTIDRIDFKNAAGSVDNSGAISNGVHLEAGGSVTNRNAADIGRGLSRYGPIYPGVRIAGAPGAVDNSGKIAGIALYNGGSVANEAGGSVVGWTSASAGVVILGPGSLANYGNITAAIGVDLTGSGGAADTLTNGGLIVGTYGTAVAFGGGNDLLRIEPGAGFGGVVDGGGGSNIAELPTTGGTGTMTGIGATFENFTIDVDAGASWVWAGSNTLGPGSVLDVAGALTVSGSLTNTTTIDVTGALADQGSLLNTGLIDGAVGVSGGGVLNNAAGATINGEVFGTGDATVANSGIIGSGGTAVAFSGSGDVLVYEPGAVFNGIAEGGGNTLELPATGGRGYLTGLGTSFVDFGAVVVNPSAQWVLYGYNNLGGGSVVLDSGAYAQNAADALLTGVGTVVTATAAASFTNYGVVSDTGATGVGVNLTAGGTVVNQPGAEISGYYGGIFVEGGAGAVINRGSISGTDNSYAIGVYLGAGGVVGNSSRITALSGSGTGVDINGYAYVTNGGLIAGSRFGVEVTGGAGTVFNYGRIAGTGGDGVGVYLQGDGSTLTNEGRIIGRGGTAVYLAGSYDTLVMDPGASFVGTVGAGGSGDTLELAAGSGTLKGLGSKFVGFSTVKLDPGGTWDIGGGEGSFVNDGTALVDGTVVFDALATDPSNHGLVDILHGSAGEFAGAVSRAQTVEFADGTSTALLDRPRGFHATFLGFTEGDVIDLIGKSVDDLSYSDHQLVLTEGGNLVADLHFAGHYTASEFALYPDGSGGTYVTLTGTTAAADLWKIKT